MNRKFNFVLRLLRSAGDKSPSLRSLYVVRTHTRTRKLYKIETDTQRGGQSDRLLTHNLHSRGKQKNIYFRHRQLITI